MNIREELIALEKHFSAEYEAARLQSFPDRFIPDQNRQQAYKQLGNSVNVNVLKEIFKKLVSYK